jgi:hypothetical protein
MGRKSVFKFWYGLHAAMVLAVIIDGMSLVFGRQEAGLNHLLIFFNKDSIAKMYRILSFSHERNEDKIIYINFSERKHTVVLDSEYYKEIIRIIYRKNHGEDRFELTPWNYLLQKEIGILLKKQGGAKNS